MTHYTCDRCGVDVPAKGNSSARDVEIDWPDAPKEKGVVVLYYSVKVPAKRSEDSAKEPDLCGDCVAHILHEIASMLDTDRVPRELVAAEAKGQD